MDHTRNIANSLANVRFRKNLVNLELGKFAFQKENYFLKIFSDFEGGTKYNSIMYFDIPIRKLIFL